MNDQKKDQAAREQSEERFGAIFDQSPFATQLLNATGHITRVNDAWKRLWEVPDELVENFILKSYNIFDDPLMISVGIERFVRRAFKGETIHLNPVFYDPSKAGNPGRSRWVEASFAPICNRSGEIVEVMIHFSDVSARIEAQEQVMAQQEKFEAILNNSPSLISLKDLAGHYLFVNQRKAEFLRANPDQVQDQDQDQTTADFYPKVQAEEFQKNDVQVFASEKAIEIEETLTCDGAECTFLSNRFSLRNRSGEVYAICQISTDITARKNAELSLKASESTFRSFAESLPHLAWAIRPNGSVEYFNKNWTDYTGTRIEEIPNAIQQEHWANAIHPDDVKDAHAVWTHAFATGIPFEFENRIKRKRDGIYRWFLARGVPVKDKDGAVLRWVGTSTDIHDQKILADSLRKAKEAAEDNSRLKSTFLANMSHEIRTPLTAMLGFADLLRDPLAAVEDRNYYVEILTRNGEQLSHLIDDILDLSKIEAGNLKLDYKTIDPKKIATDVIASLQLSAKERHLVLVLNVLESAPCLLATDPVRLRQILLNLIGNAIKFTQQGTVRIQIQGIPLDADATNSHCDSVSFEVSDTGIGIDEQNIERLFKVFSQADESMTRKFGGTGLGLALSRRLALELGGDVILEKTQKGQGSTFVATVANRKEKSSQSPKPLLNSIDLLVNTDLFKGIQVLVVDDSPDNQKLIYAYLSKSGAQVEVAHNGLEGYAKALSGDHNLVLMNIQMPVLDGFAATRLLRDKGYTKPIIALTDHAMTNSKELCLEAGCDDQITKPINLVSLIQTVAHFATAGRPTT